MAGIQDDVFPIFRTPPKSPGRCLTPSSSASNATGSPGKSPLKRRTNLTVRQGSTQNNKIFRYLQPKRLLDEAPNPSISFLNAKDHSSLLIADKENNDLELRVVLSRIDEDIVPNCTVQDKSKKACSCIHERSAESELVVQALDRTIQAYFDDPCLRLGVSRLQCSESTKRQPKMVTQMFTSTQENLFCTMMDAGLGGTMIRECVHRLSSEKFPSATMVHNVFHVMEMSVDEQTLFTCERFLQRLLCLHPPCPSMRDFYITVLHKPNKLKTSNDYWMMMTCETFEKMLEELDKCIENGLSPAQLKEKHKTPTVRKIIKPRRFRETPSPVKRTSRGRKGDISNLEAHFEDREKLAEEELNEMREQSRTKRLTLEAALKAMPLEKKIEHIFSRFKILVDILEYDLVMWLSNHTDSSRAIRDRGVCPLIVLALWKPAADTGFDSPGCRRVFSLYANSWILKVHPKHLKTLSRLVGLIAEVTAASDLLYKKTYPYMGDGCQNIARKLTDVLRNSQLEDFSHEAVLMLKPVWLQMLVSAYLLGIPPSIASVDPAGIFLSGQGKKSALWSAFLLSAVSTYHVKEADRLLQQASKANACGDVPHNCQASSHIVNYKTLLNEIVAFYQLRSKFEKICEGVQGLHFFHLFKEILS